MKKDYSIADVVPYINWIYFFHAWGMSGKPDSEKQKLKEEGLAMLQKHQNDYRTHAVVELFEANSDGDDIVVQTGDGPCRLPMLRQQNALPSLCLADFVRPCSSGIADRIGLFAASVDRGMETDFGQDPYEQMMMQLLADRLAEATVERLHEEVRKSLWGYAPDEQLSIDDMLTERFRGIRPAVGYPSLPDTSLNFVLDTLLHLSQIGIRLTENGAMRPHASVSGLMMAHPQARYFDIGPIGSDQLADYARRRGVPEALMRKFLKTN